MIFSRGLKRICDICFYMTFSSLAATTFGSYGLLITLPIIAISTFFIVALSKYKIIKYVGFLPLALVFTQIPLTIFYGVLMFPVLIYLLATIPKQDERTSEFDYATNFQVFLGLFGFMLAFVWASSIWIGDSSGYPTESILFALIFIIISITFMRSVRHDVSVTKQTRFKVMNAVTLLTVLAATVVVGNRHLLSFVLNVVQIIFVFLWVYILAPVLSAMLWIIAVVLSFIANLFSDGQGAAMDFDLPNMMFENQDFDYESGRELTQMPIVRIIFILIIVAVWIFIAYKIFKKLTNKLVVTAQRDDGVIEEWIMIDEEELSKGERRKREKEQPIRLIYRKFLLVLKRKNVEIQPFYTSEDVENAAILALEDEKTTTLRDIYIKARYGKDEPSAEEIANARQIYKDLKNKIG